jgi:hypothetical protein
LRITILLINLKLTVIATFSLPKYLFFILITEKINMSKLINTLGMDSKNIRIALKHYAVTFYVLHIINLSEHINFSGYAFTLHRGSKHLLGLVTDY